MRIFKTLIISAVILTLISCEFEGPKSEFTKPFKKGTVNLANKIGDSFLLFCYGDTISVNIVYDKETKYNYILLDKSDTLFEGTVSKFRGFYLLNRKLDNGNYQISAMQITDSTITGFGTEFLQAYAMDTLIEKGHFSSMIIDTSDRYVLNPDRKLGKSLFQSLLDTFPAQRFIVEEDIQEILDEIVLEDDVDVFIEPATKRRKITEVYPNPVVDVLNVKSAESLLDVRYALADISGKTFRTGVFNANIGEVDCEGLSPGVYFLMLRDSKESFKIVKK